ncbi:MAG: STAS domain-containing protein [Planctomycetes bacterium]|nr:STAS domain-containing protein [Planctomycetota bacterium]
MPAPKTTRETFSPETLKQDFLASVVVFLVALPLCMGIAIASGAPVAAGLITGIIGGLVVGALAGSPLQVSGPAAGLTVIVYEMIQRFGLEMLGIIVLFAGAFQLLAGSLRLGQWFRAVSPAVIKGMLAGIGVLIFASQFHVMIDDRPRGSGIENLITIPDALRKGLTAPHFGTREEREFRTKELRTVGELHRKQASVQEELAERVGRDSAASAAQPPGETAGSLSAFFDDQRELVAQTERALAEIQQFRAAHTGSKAQAIRDAAEAAVAASRSALETLERGEAAPAVQSQAAAVESLETLLRRLKNHSLAAEIGLLTIAIIILWQILAPRRLKILPAPLVAVVLATAVAAALALPVLYIEVPDNLLAELDFPTLSMLTRLADAPWLELLQGALVIAVVASAETLLCATALDQMHQGVRTKYDRELCAQGTGNMLCGLLGALPMTGVIVRSSTNVLAGARTRLSAILHGLWLLIFVAGLAFLLRMIPTASLAAILVYTGYKLIDVKAIKQFWALGKGELAIYAATVGTIVVKDLLTGIIVGVVLSGVKLLYIFSHLKTRLRVEPHAGKAVLSLEGAATFIRLPRLATELERVPRGFELHVDFERLDFIDHACLDLLTSWGRQHEATGGRLVIDWDSLQVNSRPTHATARRVREPEVQPREKVAV